MINNGGDFLFFFGQEPTAELARSANVAVDRRIGSKEGAEIFPSPSRRRGGMRRKGEEKDFFFSFPFSLSPPGRAGGRDGICKKLGNGMLRSSFLLSLPSPLFFSLGSMAPIRGGKMTERSGL